MKGLYSWSASQTLSPARSSALGPASVKPTERLKLVAWRKKANGDIICVFHCLNRKKTERDLSEKGLKEGQETMGSSSTTGNNGRM